MATAGQQSAGVDELTSPAGARATMRGHVLVQPGHIELRELPRPVAGPDGVVVRVRAALTCGTDVKTFVRGHPIFPTPTLFGHEFAGDVVEVGSQIHGIEEGEAVMAAPTAPCGVCYHCQRAQENLCAQVTEQFVVGAFAEYVRLPAAVVRTNLFRKPAVVSYAEAALLEPLACVLHGLSHLTLRADDTVVLIGAGPIALLHLLVLRQRGIDRVIVLARNSGRAARVRALGGEVLPVAVESARAPVLALTEGRGADVVIECTGEPTVWEAAPALARRGGQVELFGGCRVGSTVCFDTARLHYDQVAITSPFHFTPRDVRAAFELLASGGFGGEALITDVLPLERLEEALARHRSGEGAKFAIRPDAA